MSILKESDFVGSGEIGTRSEVLNPLFVGILPGLVLAVAAPIPWLDAHKRRIFASCRRPQSHQRRIKRHAQIGSFVAREERNLLHLAVFEDNGIGIKCVASNLDIAGAGVESVVGTVETPLLAYHREDIVGGSRRKSHIALILRFGVIVQIIERRMGTNLEVQFLAR